MPSKLSRAGSAAVRVRLPSAASGATKQLTTARVRPDIASTALVAAEASAYGPGGHNAPIRAPTRRRVGSSRSFVSAKPADCGLLPRNHDV